MSELHGSKGFIWDVKVLLGQGATSMVCAGRNKHTGEQVAVKVFNYAGSSRPSDVKNREFEVLKKMDHENIVRMIACEKEQNTPNIVIVMELCTGGSLYAMLEDPKHAFGVEEEEFILILAHVASGMKHLREKKIIHRDIKPGNIMRFIAEDGRSIYKLTDFGAARELHEEGQFVSLYGTEEYLHPDMYERAVLRGVNPKRFGATVDLWSLGVTFYHVLTGQLPFRPFGGRRNKETMHLITTQKESGVISGVQSNEGGPIEWSRELPASCRISLGLQLLVVPFLAGLLEADARKAWQFDKFFVEARKITSKKVLPVFSPSTWQLLKIYADPQDSLIKLQELVAKQTELPAASQILMYQNKLLSDLVDLAEPVYSYPKCISKDKPIFVFPLEDREFYFPNPFIYDFPRFTTTMNLDNDYPLSKLCVGILHAIHREISDTILLQRLSHDAVICYKNQLYHFLEHLRDYNFHLRSLCSETKKRKLDQLMILSASHNPDVNYQPNVTRLNHLEKKMTDGLAKVEEYITQFDTEISDSRSLLKAWDFTLGCSPDHRCADRLEISIKSAVGIMERFRQDRKKSSLPYNDEQIHKFEKNNLYTHTLTAKKMVKEHCNEKSKTLSDQLSIWLRKGNELRNKSGDVEKLMEELVNVQKTFTETLDKNRENSQKLLEKSLPLLPLNSAANGIETINNELCQIILQLSSVQQLTKSRQEPDFSVKD